MKGSQAVIDYLNFLISGELGARDQYFIHEQMYHEWHYLKLHTRMHHEMEEESDHARALINRVLMLEGTPNMKVADINIGHDVPSMLKADLQLEYAVRQHLKDGIALCEQEQDYVTREILVAQLVDTEEDHAHWLEQQLRLIDMMGLPNYLQSQLGDISE